MANNCQPKEISQFLSNSFIGHMLWSLANQGCGLTSCLIIIQMKHCTHLHNQSVAGYEKNFLMYVNQTVYARFCITV